MSLLFLSFISPISFSKFLKSPPLNRTINDMFQGIFRHEDLCCILQNSQLIKNGIDTKMITLYNRMLYIYDPIKAYEFNSEKPNVIIDFQKDLSHFDVIALLYKLTQAKICANLLPYGISSILCDSTGRLAKPVIETNSAYISINGLVNDDKNAYSTNDTLRLPSSKIISSSTEIPDFDKKSMMGTLFAVLVVNSSKSDLDSNNLIFDIKFIATKNMSVTSYCSKRSLPFIQLGTFRCLELADNNKDIYTHVPSNYSEEYTYFPNFVFEPSTEWTLPSTIIPYKSQYHEILSLLWHEKNKLSMKEISDEDFLTGGIFYSEDRYTPIIFISKKKFDSTLDHVLNFNVKESHFKKKEDDDKELLSMRFYKRLNTDVDTSFTTPEKKILRSDDASDVSNEENDEMNFGLF